VPQRSAAHAYDAHVLCECDAIQLEELFALNHFSEARQFENDLNDTCKLTQILVLTYANLTP
jgi:hypothetical protein